MQTRSPETQPLPRNGDRPVGLDEIRHKLARYSPRTLAESSSLAHAAVALILRKDGASGESEILIIWRAEQPGDPWSGHLGFPGGRVEPHDASPQRTAARETQEELGISLDSCSKFLGRLSEVRAVSLSRMMPLSIFPYVCELVEPVALRLNCEVDKTRWIPLRYFLNMSNRSTMSHPREPSRLLPCYRLGDRAIWGLSLAMLDELLVEVMHQGV